MGNQVNVKMCLEYISDVVGVPIKMNHGDKGPSVTSVTASVNAEYSPLPGLSIMMPLIAKKLLVSNTVVAVLFSVVGDMSMLVAYNPNTQTASLFIIDGTKVKDNETRVPPSAILGSSFDLPMAVKALGSAIVKCFAMKKGKWTPFELKQ